MLQEETIAAPNNGTAGERRHEGVVGGLRVSGCKHGSAAASAGLMTR